MNCKGLDVLRLLADELPHVGFFYFVLNTLQGCYGDRDFRVSWEKLAERYSPKGLYSIKHVRYALKRLVVLGLIATDGQSRRFTLVRVHSLRGAEKGAVRGAEKGAENLRKNQPVLKSEGAEKGAVRGAEKGDGVDVAVDVGVSPSALKNSSTAFSSDRSASSPDIAKVADAKEREWVKNVLFKDCPLYQSDQRLNAVDQKTGRIKAAALYSAWKAAYPAVDVFAAIRGAHAWEVANDKRQKKDKAPYLNRWLAKEQDRGGVFKNSPVAYDRKSSPSYEQMPREIKRPVVTPEKFQAEPPPTDEEIAWMHRETVKAIGPCRDAECKHCPKLVAVPEEEELPV